jgi:hypothetical protein
MLPGGVPRRLETIMQPTARHASSAGASSLRRPLIGVYSVLIVANLAVWVWAVLVFQHQPVFLGTALLAYGFGLRHAVDADHIAAIDNVTRKLMQEGKRPVTVGFFFALGHSTVVIRRRRGRDRNGAERTLRPVQVDRRVHRHAGVGGVPVRDCDRQPAHLALGLADLPPCEGRRPLRGRRLRHPAQ